jgi:hypothetical protein
MEMSFCTPERFNFWHVHTLRSVFVNSPPPKPEVILTNFFAEPTVLLVPITSRAFGNSWSDKLSLWVDVHPAATILCCGECFHD